MIAINNHDILPGSPTVCNFLISSVVNTTCSPPNVHARWISVGNSISSDSYDNTMSMLAFIINTQWQAACTYCILCYDFHFDLFNLLSRSSDVFVLALFLLSDKVVSLEAAIS